MIGEKVRAIRKINGLTMEKLSRKSGVAKSAIFNLEHGRTGARYETVEWLLEAMGYELIIVRKEQKNG